MSCGFFFVSCTTLFFFFSSFFHGDGGGQVRDNVMLEHSSGGDTARDDEPVFLRCVPCVSDRAAASQRSSLDSTANYRLGGEIAIYSKTNRRGNLSKRSII